MPRSAYPSLLGERYQLSRPLAEGGMAAVFECIDTWSTTNEKRAAKLLLLDLVGEEEVVALFNQECELLSRLDHPFIIKTHDYGVESGWPYMIMELVRDHGQQPVSLQQLQQRNTRNRLSLQQLEQLVPKLLAAVAEIHRLGLVHRDLKPDNVLVQQRLDGTLLPRIIDFGLAVSSAARHARHRSAEAVPAGEQATAQAFAGTLAYMSPEQKRGEKLDARSDVYSLGLLINELATGELPETPPTKPSRVVSGLPQWIDELVVGSVVERRPARFKSAADMLARTPASLLAADQRDPGLSRRHWLALAVGVAASVAIALAGPQELRGWLYLFTVYLPGESAQSLAHWLCGYLVPPAFVPATGYAELARQWWLPPLWALAGGALLAWRCRGRPRYLGPAALLLGLVLAWTPVHLLLLHLAGLLGCLLLVGALWHLAFRAGAVLAAPLAALATLPVFGLAEGMVERLQHLAAWSGTPALWQAAGTAALVLPLLWQIAGALRPKMRR